jgi:class 3 adenylate cyclase
MNSPQLRDSPPAPRSDNITFLFTDIEGSTKLWETDPAIRRTWNDRCR